MQNGKVVLQIAFKRENFVAKNFQIKNLGNQRTPKQHTMRNAMASRSGIYWRC